MHTSPLPPSHQMLSQSLFHFPLLHRLHLHPSLRTFKPQAISYPSLHFPSPSPLSHHHFIFQSPPTLCYSSNSSSSSSSSSKAEEDDFEVELGRLLALLPDEMRQRVTEHPEFLQLIEVVMDLGRKPLARFPSGDFVLSEHPITFQDLQHATSQVGDFAIDNRAGISRTLHRISAIRNRKGSIVGLTCRVGRAISGSANLLRDLVKDGSSLLLIGPPGVGKTTIIREIARMIADDYKKRVMIVDTSNEIGGDGDIPHEGIGSARRMQVPNSDVQHKVLIEAVENHMPQVIVIDEIGTKLEALAASTIAQRGIQLVATAHGVTIENLVMNPSLEMLVGGIQSVTLGDEEASRRGVQKTVLERKGPSTFTCGVEIISKTELRVHRSLEATVDAILSGRAPIFDLRKINGQGTGYEMLKVEREPFIDNCEKQENLGIDDLEMYRRITTENEPTSRVAAGIVENSSQHEEPVRLFVYGILETSVIQGIRQLKVDDAIDLIDNISEADALLALQSKLKKNPRIRAVAESHKIPIYVTKTSSLVQIMKAIKALMIEHEYGIKDFEAADRSSSSISSEQIDALEEARLAIEQVVIPKGDSIELLPRSAHIISLQIDLVRKYQLQSENVGEEPNIRLRILPLNTSMDRDRQASEMIDNGNRSDDGNTSGDFNDSVYRVDRLPLLPD